MKNYIYERIRNPTIGIIANGKLIKKVPFLAQAIKYKNNHQSELWHIQIDIVNIETGEDLSGYPSRNERTFKTKYARML